MAFDRRAFLKGLGCTGGVLLAPAIIAPLRPEWGDVAAASSLFTLGVASGDPSDQSVVLWTRLAPDPLNGGGMGSNAVDVLWEVATDPGMHHVIRAGSVSADPKNAHAVSVNVEGLFSDSWYYYQFTHAGERSRIGRTRTLPSRGSVPSRLRFALVSCQHYESGYYAAYRDIAQQDLDFVIHLGDYIYEFAANPLVPVERRHNGGETKTLADYRNRYALYKLDPQLQDAHAAFPFVVTWDDHEVDDNYAGLVPEDRQSAQAFFQRRAAAYQAYLEHMPLVPTISEVNGVVNLYRSFSYGDLADFFVLDTRQMRTDQPCGNGYRTLQSCPDIMNPAGTLLGDTQETWLFDNLQRSDATWKVMAQQVMMMKWDLGALLGGRYNYYNVDAWDGYQVARDRIMTFLADHAVQNAVVLSGDIHAAWAANLRDFSSPDSPVVGAEFVCSSITSPYGDRFDPLTRFTLPTNPHVRFFDGLHRGYSLCTVTPTSWRTDYRAVRRVAGDPLFTVPSPDISLFRLASFGLTAGQSGLRRLL